MTQHNQELQYLQIFLKLTTEKKTFTGEFVNAFKIALPQYMIYNFFKDTYSV